MMCTYCDNFETNVWPCMKLHYKHKHPTVKRPDKLFTREARTGYGDYGLFYELQLTDGVQSKV